MGALKVPSPLPNKTLTAPWEHVVPDGATQSLETTKSAFPSALKSPVAIADASKPPDDRFCPCFKLPFPLPSRTPTPPVVQSAAFRHPFTIARSILPSWLKSAVDADCVPIPIAWDASKGPKVPSPFPKRVMTPPSPAKQLPFALSLEEHPFGTAKSRLPSPLKSEMTTEGAKLPVP